MSEIIVKTLINNTIEVCYKLSLNVDLHKESTAKTGERIVAGVKSGIMKLGDNVTWKAKHFGIWQTLTTKIIVAEPFSYFVDEMQKGAFKSMRHEHYFTELGNATLMKDVFKFESPFGIFGKLFNFLILKKYMQRFLMERNQLIKEVAESDNFEKYIFNN
jgi:ligand-binding SRPBCC domain-containing protein